MPNFNDSMKAKVAPAAINTGLDRPAGTGSTNDLLYTLWGGTEKSINDRGNAYFNAPSGPTFRAASSTTTVTGTPGNYGFTIPIPTGTVAGDVLVAQVWIRGDSKAGTLGTAPAGWTQRGTFDTSYPTLGWKTYSRIATGTDSFVWTGGDYWEEMTAAMISVSGGTAVDVVGPGGNSALTAVAPSVTTTTSPTLLVGLFSVLENAVAAPASMTSRVNITKNNGYGGNSQVIATQELAATGATGTRTCPTSSFSVRYSQLIAIK